MVHITEIKSSGLDKGPAIPAKEFTKFRKYQAYELTYNPRVHGPYQPWLDYSKNPRTPILDMKLGQIWPTFVNGNKTFEHSRFLIGKTFWKIIRPRFNTLKTSFKPFIQLTVISGLCCFALRFKDYAAERRVKYHW